MTGRKFTRTNPHDVLTADTPRDTINSPTGTDGDSPIRQPSVIMTQAGSGHTAWPERFFVTPNLPVNARLGDTHVPTGTERLGPTGSPRNEPAEATPTAIIDSDNATAGNEQAGNVYDRALIRAACAWLTLKGYKATVSGNRITAARRRNRQ